MLKQLKLYKMTKKYSILATVGLLHLATASLQMVEKEKMCKGKILCRQKMAKVAAKTARKTKLSKM
jgi:hypothetical protein